MSMVSGTSAIAAKKPKPSATGGLSKGIQKPQRGRGDGTYGGKNVATAWTTACYGQFGPNAKYPDAGLLQNCLSK